MRRMKFSELADHYWLRLLQHTICPIAGHKWKRRMHGVVCERCMIWSEAV